MTETGQHNNHTGYALTTINHHIIINQLQNPALVLRWFSLSKIRFLKMALNGSFPAFRLYLLLYNRAVCGTISICGQ